MYRIDLLSISIFLTVLPAFINCESIFTSLWNGINSGISSLSYSKIKCKYGECCTPEYVYTNVDKLDKMLEEDLYGQEIAHNIVINALQGHISLADPPKALTMSFHGTPGTGKTYVALMIAKALYKKGVDSKYYHYFNGRNDFPLEREVEQYKEQLRKSITDSLVLCERSMFVFDEVDKMPEGLLNVLVPFLDYNTWHRSWRYSDNDFMNKKKAVYIFLSNTGSTQIVQRLLNLWEEGKQRSLTKLQDFEYLISVGAFNEKGGFYRSDTITTSVIDHYVPFLPLEDVHIRKCLKRAFRDRGVEPTKGMIEEGMSHVTFGPPPHNLYSTAGCKRLEQKAAAIVYSHRRATEF